MKRIGLLVFSLTLVYWLSPSTPASAHSAAATKVSFSTLVQAPAPAASVVVLCDGQVFDGQTFKPFVLQSASDQDPNIQKVIRNCTFRNSSQPAIVLQAAKNVLIEGNKFENIHTNIPGDGVHAININCSATAGCSAPNPIDNIVIRNNTFRRIGADGVQLGDQTRYISNVYIQNNEFVGRADVGENAIDVKGVEGPISITGNHVHGFRPCESPNTSPPGRQDCSGSNGEGIIVHDGGLVPTPAYNVTLENNDINDNTLGVVVATGTRNIVVRGNRISNNQLAGVHARGIFSLVVTGNTLSNNPTQIQVFDSPLPGGSCTINSNVLLRGTAVIPGGCN